MEEKLIDNEMVNEGVEIVELLPETDSLDSKDFIKLGGGLLVVGGAAYGLYKGFKWVKGKWAAKHSESQTEMSIIPSVESDE